MESAVESAEAEEGNGGVEVPSILAQDFTSIVKRCDPSATLDMILLYQR